MNAPVTPLRSDAEAQMIAHFNALKAGNAGDLLTRAAAFSQFEKSGLPHRRIESWHYTDLRRLMAEALAPSERPNAATLQAALAGKDAAPRIVLLEGFFAGAADLPAGVSAAAKPIAAARLGTDDVLVALNTAFAPEIVEIDIAEGVELTVPLHLLSKVKKKAAATWRVHVRVGKGAKVLLLEETRAESGQINNLIHLDIADGAEVSHVALSGNPGQQVATFTAELGGHAVLNSFAFVAGGGLVRRQAFVRFAGEYSKAGLRGVSLLRGNQHADTTLVVEHDAPHCESRELFKHILDGEAKGVFQGKIIVQPHAQKTDGVMKSNTLALSESASMSNKPELEIFADDVVCGHGATVGQLDEDQLFYLMARGLPKAQAESLLIEAFAVDALEAVEDEALRDMIAHKVHDWLKSRSAQAI